MPESFLLSRVLIRFNGKADEPLGQDLSAAAFTPDGSLWVGSDETRTIVYHLLSHIFSAIISNFLLRILLIYLIKKAKLI